MDCPRVGGTGDDPVEGIDLHARMSIGFPARSPEVHHHTGNTFLQKVVLQALGVMGFRRTGQTVKDQYKRPVGVAGRVAPVEVDEVAIGQFNALTLPGNVEQFAKQRRPHRLQVRARQPPGRVK